MSIFAFDPSGRLEANKIINESHTINVINGTEHNYIVPRNAPFFKESMTIINADTGKALGQGDFECTHKFTQADDELALKLFGSVTFTDRNMTGRFHLVYQTLGGDFVTATTQAITNGIATLNELRTVDWESLSGVPAEFPITHHTQPITDTQMIPEFLNALESIKASLADPNTLLKMDDIKDLDVNFINPFMAGMQGIAAAITNKNYGTNNPFEFFSSGGSEQSAGAKPADVWFDIGAVTVKIDGTYKTDWHLTNVPVSEDGRYVESRFVVNGQTIGSSYDNGGATPFAKDSVVTLQARVRGGNTADFFLTKHHRPTVFSIVRLGM